MLVIEFGSGRRGDCDLTSDRDILLIGTDWQKISYESAKWCINGFSVSTFLFDKASYLASKGNLFFKHIFDEGVLVFGSEARYRELKDRWQAAADYWDEVRDNLDLLEVIHFIPQTSAGIAVAIDILISSVRNILIRRLACDGKYVFAWGKVFVEANKRQMIKKEDIHLFMTSRCLKNKYRQGFIQNLPLSYLEALLEASNRACGVMLRPNFAYRAALRSLPEKYLDGTYKQLRALELMCAEYLFDKSLDPLMSIVRTPAYFCVNGPAKSIRRCQKAV
ncbi:hypothetical protein GCAAIG_06420 [Candidatus Electronema halotolerans]